MFCYQARFWKMLRWVTEVYFTLHSCFCMAGLIDLFWSNLPRFFEVHSSHIVCPIHILNSHFKYNWYFAAERFSHFLPLTEKKTFIKLSAEHSPRYSACRRSSKRHRSLAHHAINLFLAGLLSSLFVFSASPFSKASPKWTGPSRMNSVESLISRTIVFTWPLL